MQKAADDLAEATESGDDDVVFLRLDGIGVALLAASERRSNQAIVRQQQERRHHHRQRHHHDQDRCGFGTEDLGGRRRAEDHEGEFATLG